MTVDERLPPVRQLAAALRLATGTVARAYRELEQAGHVVSRRGGGTRVAARRAGPVHPAAVLAEYAASYVAKARTLGFDDDEILQAVRPPDAPGGVSGRGARSYSGPMRRSTRSSTERNGSLHSTVR